VAHRLLRRPAAGLVAGAAAAALSAGCALQVPAPSPPAPPPAAEPAAAPTEPPLRWRDSRAVGRPWAGRLVRGVRLPAEGEHVVTWDPVRRASPNRPWRRWGTDETVRRVLAVARSHRRAHPLAPRIAVGDLSRPHGGPFGKRFGGLGHLSHQNGLDVDVYYPRLDRLELAPRRASQVDRLLAQDLVNRFLAIGAEKIFVGPGTGLAGPRRRVRPLIHHHDHMHVRFPRERDRVGRGATDS